MSKRNEARAATVIREEDEREKLDWVKESDHSDEQPGGRGGERQNAPVPRMRTMQECVDYFALNDPETSLKYCTLRRWVLEGKVPFLQIGSRKLINLDLLIDMVNGKQSWPEQKTNLKILQKGRR